MLRQAFDEVGYSIVLQQVVGGWGNIASVDSIFSGIGGGLFDGAPISCIARFSVDYT